MAIIVEDGTGVADAESLATVEQADAYHAGRGNEVVWAAFDRSRKEQLLRQGYDHLIGEYGGVWDSEEPFGVVEGSVPGRMVQANALLALYARSGPLAPERKPQKLKVKVGPIETEYAELEQVTRDFPDVDRLVSPFLPSRGGNPYMVPLERS